MNMAFSLTTPQMYACTKRVTRRNGRMPPVGVPVNAIEKGMGIPKGGHVVVIGSIRFDDIRDEPLRRMTDDLEYGRRECILEGFPDKTPAEFVAMYCKANHCTPEQIVHRGAFTHLYELHEPVTA